MGLLLSADLHLPFDAYLLSIDPKDGSVAILQRLADSGYGALNGKELCLPSDHHNDPNPSLLALHYNQFIIENQGVVIL